MLCIIIVSVECRNLLKNTASSRTEGTAQVADDASKTVSDNNGNVLILYYTILLLLIKFTCLNVESA